MREIDIGGVEDYANPPAHVVVDGQQYFLCREGERWYALSAICPHKGGCVVDQGDVLACPQHGWKFDRQSGHCLNVSRAALASFPVENRAGRLYFHTRHEHVPADSPRVVRKGDFSVTLHSHACLEIEHRGFRLLTDPWLDGPAFMGSWTQYPPPIVTPNDLRPDAILITHEHSDHFHEPTLAHFSRATPIYAPDFPNRRILRRLGAMGFTNVVPLEFGETKMAAPSVRLAAFEPAGIWNDAIFLIDIADFRILNLNDAGINRNISEKLGPVDLVAAQFSVGASGYPWTWDHVPTDQKVAIMNHARSGRLEMLEQVVDLYHARYLLPFASHFALWHPSHREFMNLLPRVTFEDIRGALGEKVVVLDLLPGSQWNARTEETVHVLNERQWFDGDHALRYVAKNYNETQFRRIFADTPRLCERALKEHLLRLNDTPEIVFCEDLRVAIELLPDDNGEPTRGVTFEIRRGHLQIVDDQNEPNLVMKLPEQMVAKIVYDDDSWDELHIGYWGRFHRTPDVYAPGFWRLLQAPYYQRRLSRSQANGLSIGPEQSSVSGDSIVAQLLESNGEQVSRIMRRYGLYCAGCHRSTYETLETAARQHGLAETRAHDLVRELQAVCRGRFGEANSGGGESP